MGPLADFLYDVALDPDAFGQRIRRPGKLRRDPQPLAARHARSHADRREDRIGRVPASHPFGHDARHDDAVTRAEWHRAQGPKPVRDALEVE
ncbi:MAG: hypothetical protein DMD34_01495 [Gemmatimonadetes bacterium]|nr:MAG: hypothetical protein DMD34_01495 [Gemmatimonadota bacterium]